MGFCSNFAAKFETFNNSKIEENETKNFRIGSGDDLRRVNERANRRTNQQQRHFTDGHIHV